MTNNNFIILAGLKSFIITSGDGAPDNQYRIRDKHVEFRSLMPNERSQTIFGWRVLEPEEVQLHFALRTPVADWLDKTLYLQAPAA